MKPAETYIYGSMGWEGVGKRYLIYQKIGERYSYVGMANLSDKKMNALLDAGFKVIRTIKAIEILKEVQNDNNI